MGMAGMIGLWVGVEGRICGWNSEKERSQE